VLSLIQSAHAAPYNTGVNFTICGTLNLGITLVFWLGVGLTLVFVTMGGIKYMSSQADPKATDAARKTLTNAVIGFVVVIGALAIRTLTSKLLGINLSNCDETVFLNAVNGTF